MHPPPPVQITVRHFSRWRALLWALACVLLILWSAWFWVETSWAVRWAWSMLAGMALLGLGSMLVIRPFSLRWDTQAWAWGPESDRGHESELGDVSVALDLGSWMLLKFIPRLEGRFPWLPWRIRWLPVQRHGHEAVWHVLRCAVYARGALPVDVQAR